MNLWIEKNKSLPEVKKMTSELADMYDEVLNSDSINHHGTRQNLPEKLTKDHYIEIYSTLF